MINKFIFLLLTFNLVLMFVLSYLDISKTRIKKSNPFISFIIPCHNAEKTIETAIESLYKSYNNFELIVINDKSHDNSLDIIKKLQRKYKFLFVDNPKNLGKAKSINLIAKKAKGEILFILDVDCVLDKKIVEDMISRFDYNPKLGAVSSFYKPKNKGILPYMQEIEYNFLHILGLAHNLFSCVALTGGCLAVKRKAFFDVGMFSENAIAEDMDLALKLNQKDYKVEESRHKILSEVPNNLKLLFKQKIRWISGQYQCLIRYPLVYLKNPIFLIFSVTYCLLIGLFIYYLIKSFILFLFFVDLFKVLHNSGYRYLVIMEIIWDSTGGIFALLSKLSLLIFSLPFAMISVTKPKLIYKLIYIFPFAFIYYPIFLTLFIFGIFFGTYKYIKLKNKKRGW